MKDFDVVVPKLDNFPPICNNSNRQRIKQIKKQLFDDALFYNKVISQKLKNDRKLLQQKQRKQAYIANQEIIKQIQFQNMIKTKQKNIQKNKLRQSYDQQLKLKLQYKLKQKQYDEQYAKIQKDYSNFSEERRVKEFFKMYKRPAYQPVYPGFQNYIKRHKTQTKEGKLSQSLIQNQSISYQSRYNKIKKSQLHESDNKIKNKLSINRVSCLYINPEKKYTFSNQFNIKCNEQKQKIAEYKQQILEFKHNSFQPYYKI